MKKGREKVIKHICVSDDVIRRFIKKYSITILYRIYVMYARADMSKKIFFLFFPLGKNSFIFFFILLCLRMRKSLQIKDENLRQWFGWICRWILKKYKLYFMIHKKKIQLFTVLRALFSSFGLEALKINSTILISHNKNWNLFTIKIFTIRQLLLVADSTKKVIWDLLME